MTAFVAFGSGLVMGLVVWFMSRSMFEAPVLQRTNFRGRQVPVAAGVVLVSAVVAVEAIWRLYESVSEPTSTGALMAQSSRLLTLVTVLGFGLLGAFDDVAAFGDDRGFKGHLSSMARGRLTTGGLKLLIGGLLAVIPIAAAGVGGPGELVVGALLVALAANLGNLFDRAPGRTGKVSLLGGVALLAATEGGERPLLTGAMVVLGAGAALLVPDLREQLMLGDAGANVLGAALGLAVVFTTSETTQLVVLVVLGALNLASEKVSFSRVIDGFAPLRFLDRLGRRAS